MKRKQAGSDVTPEQLERFVMATSEAGQPPRRVRKNDYGHAVCVVWRPYLRRPIEQQACDVVGIPRSTDRVPLGGFCIDDSCPRHPLSSEVAS